ncbi:homogentisate 1,2-dioxygenase domain-containing protein [Pseudoroseomonas cervicalis]|uniref:homogentisate 1,2-dioxygenase domain-containing protein n=1 Tax=Teichococcus cervicalis TaxID=204525 RepID=UPI0027D8C2BE|nr:homogentisate 1,2-dioxygenase domain-containing protein [Pseudoroseomonas cervicalis]
MTPRPAAASPLAASRCTTRCCRHGPDRDAFEAASRATLAPHKLSGTLAFMFETRLPQRVTRYAAEAPQFQADYALYGQRLERHFDPARRDPA